MSKEEKKWWEGRLRYWMDERKSGEELRKLKKRTKERESQEEERGR